MDGSGIGERVKRLRKERGWSVRGLASQAGVSHNYVNLLEGGQVPSPGIGQLRKLADAMSVGLDWLLEEGDEEGQGGETEAARAAARAMEEIRVNLLAINKLDPEELEYLAKIVAATKEKVERQNREVKRGESPGRKASR